MFLWLGNSPALVVLQQCFTGGLLPDFLQITSGHFERDIHRCVRLFFGLQFFDLLSGFFLLFPFFDALSHFLNTFSAFGFWCHFDYLAGFSKLLALLLLLHLLKIREFLLLCLNVLLGLHTSLLQYIAYFLLLLLPLSFSFLSDSNGFISSSILLQCL